MKKKNTSGVESAPAVKVENTSAYASQSNDNEQNKKEKIKVEEPAPQPEYKQKEAVVIPDVVQEKPQPTTAPATNSRRLSKGMLTIDDETIKAAVTRDSTERVLTQEVGEQIFEEYKKQLQAANKAAIYAQFTMMQLEVRPPDEVHIISSSELTDMYAKEERSQLIDFYRAKAQMIVRITMEIQIDEAVKAEQSKNMVLSKSEIFDLMASKNPSLGKLKDTLGMQIEY